jgi:hypothetical protein
VVAAGWPVVAPRLTGVAELAVRVSGLAGMVTSLLFLPDLSALLESATAAFAVAALESGVKLASELSFVAAGESFGAAAFFAVVSAATAFGARIIT